MYISRSNLIAILAYGSSVAAAPAGNINTCNPVDAVYAILKGSLKDQASSFCLDFLGGPTTVQVTQTNTVAGAGHTVTVTNPDQTQTANVDVTNVNHVTRTVDQTAANPTTTITVTYTAGTKTVYQKREAAPTHEKRAAIPSLLVAFASSRISSACSCIVTPTTLTVTNTAVQTVAGPEATQTVAGNQVTVTITHTALITSEDTITRTVGPAATEVQTVATTVTPILVKPKVCNAKGLPGANAFNYDANFNTDQASCVASCKTDNRCLSTGFYLVTDPTTGSTTGTCRKYDKSLTDSADLGFGYYNWNDKAC